MIVVSDNGPIAFLVQIDLVDLLRRLYGGVVVPSAVLAELRDSSTPEPILSWAQNLPTWIAEREPAQGASRRGAGAGEQDAIEIAKELGALLLCDDRQAVSRARREGLIVTGTRGVLRDAHVEGWIDIEKTLDALRTNTDFRFPPANLLAQLLADAHNQRPSP